VWRVPLVPALVFAIALTACSGREDEPRQQRADAFAFTSAAERSWLRRLDNWADGLYQATDDAAAIETDEKALATVIASVGEERRRYLRTLEPFERCSSSLRIDVGLPPTRRLRSLRDRIFRACDAFERHIGVIYQGLALGESEVVDRANLVFAEGEQLLDAALKSLPPAQRRPLPELGGPRTRSRVEPEFSRVASQLAQKDVEARCWSTADWQRLLVDLEAVDGEAVPESLGFAVAGGKRIQLAPLTCLRLARRRYEKERPESLDPRMELATGVATLAHERAHMSRGPSTSPSPSVTPFS
jgi:hypothetical protein